MNKILSEYLYGKRMTKQEALDYNSKMADKVRHGIETYLDKPVDGKTHPKTDGPKLMGVTGADVQFPEPGSHTYLIGKTIKGALSSIDWSEIVLTFTDGSTSCFQMDFNKEMYTHRYADASKYDKEKLYAIGAEYYDYSSHRDNSWEEGRKIRDAEAARRGPIFQAIIDMPAEETYAELSDDDKDAKYDYGYCE